MCPAPGSNRFASLAIVVVLVVMLFIALHAQVGFFLESHVVSI